MNACESGSTCTCSGQYIQLTVVNVLPLILCYRVQYLRHIRDFFGLVFKIDVHKSGFGSENDDLMVGGDKVLLTCTGIGFRNLSKVVH